MSIGGRDILERLPKAEARVQLIRSLNGGLLIGAENGGTRGRPQMETNDVGGFGLKLRIVAGM